MDQWNRTENPEINPCLHGKLIFDKEGRSIKWSENSLFNKWCWEIWTATCKKIKLNRPTAYTIHKKPLKMAKNPWNVSCNTIEVLEENIGRKISDIPCRNIFTDMSPRARDIKGIINKWDFIKIKSFCTAKEIYSAKWKGNQPYGKIYLPMILQTRV